MTWVLLVRGAMFKTVLVTGGAGFIGSHIVVRLLEIGVDVIIFDNFNNSDKSIIDRIEKITHRRPNCIEGDVRDRFALAQLFRNYPINAVIHLAGLKAVDESERKPLVYYDTNVNGSLSLFEAMDNAGVYNLVFSSSATVYGHHDCMQYRESMMTLPMNVYGRTKLIVEDMLRDLKRGSPLWHIASLRYFNPVGAHASGLIGENPSGIPHNLMPFIAQVATGQREKLYIFGDDYPTPDGTCLRDYIHVDDLAHGHICALNAIQHQEDLMILNLGTGKAYSVLDMVLAFEKNSGRTIPYEIVARREGDLAAYYADPALASDMIGWVAHHDLDRMCLDMWRWQVMSTGGDLER